ncbi:MAG TPA: hypothetical protein VGI40_00600 [Pirellulaceae bacterium]
MHIESVNRFARAYGRQSVIIAGAVVSLLAICIAAAYFASQQPPRFYRQAMTASSADALRHGENFERAALDLHNSAQHLGRWEISLTADEINGWLATDLPAKFPRLLPTGISDPRVAIDGDVFHLAVRYQRGSVDTVLSIAGEAYLTAQTNEVAIRLDSARAGLVPIPLGRVIQEINDRAERADVNLRWTEVKGSPVALLRLPLESDNSERRSVLDRLDTRPNQILLAGRTELLSAPHDHVAAPATAGQSDKTTRQR